MLGHFFDQRNRRRKGGLLRARTINANVLSATGHIYTLPPTQMLAPVSFANKSGSANLSIPDANRRIMATSAIPEGQSQTISFEAISGDGIRVPYTVTLAVPLPVLNALTLPAASLPENALAGALVGLLTGRTAGSTISLIDSAGNRFSMNAGGDGIVRGATALDFEATQGHDIIVEETHPTAVNSPRQSTIHVAVTNVLEVVLSDVTLDTPIVDDTAPPGTLIDALNGIAPGATVSLFDDAGGRFALSGADIVVGLTDIDALATPTLSITVRQTHADSANSPHDTVITIDVESAVVGLTVTGTLDPAQFAIAYTDSLTVSGGTGPYSVSGLPAYGPAATVTGGTISFTGTPR